MNAKAELINTIASTDHYDIFIGSVEMIGSPNLFVRIGLAMTRSGVALKVEKNPTNDTARNKNVLISKLLQIIVVSFFELGTVTTSEY